ncbi:hypothetical protein EZS27_003606 [termite gut metagenome]|uniref:Uncharacterized protein n=1 Tax=termite gut metagenome TaxID=433724 RepID=A0A5J4SS87_9ZZZZ
MLTNQTAEKTPSVVIELAPHLHDFLYHEFACSKKKYDGVMITVTNDIGKYIQSMIDISNTPKNQEIKENPIKLYLPTQEWNHYIFQKNFLFVPVWRQKMIQDYIEASFRIRIREYFQEGYSKGFKQERILQSFLLSYNIKNNAINYDAVKKYDYRYRQKIREEVGKEIQLADCL